MMVNFATAGWDTLLAPREHACTCGKCHRTDLRYLRIEEGAIGALPEALLAIGKKKPFVVCDDNTYRAAGESAVAILERQGIPYGLFVFPHAQEKMEPDEHAVGALAMAFDPSCDVVLAVGSGVINDCCKVLAHTAGIPSMVIGTAPSMDGYASNSSSMIQNRIKVTLYNACPAAILADLSIMRQAPMKMLHAGLGDMLAKFISLCEWQIAHLVTGEYYCENVAGLMRSSVEKCVAAAPGLVERRPQSVKAVVEGLILSGIAMSYASVSRPASGLEHYFSHIWEMMALERGEESELHGTQVGVGTVLTLRLYDQIRQLAPSRERAEAAMAAFSPEKWALTMRAIFGKIADTVIHAENTQYHKNDPQKHAQRLGRILEGWPRILAIIEESLPKTEEILSLMQGLGMKTTPASLGISLEDTRMACIGSREIRDKYLTSSLLWDLGELDRLTNTLRDD